MVGTHPQDSCAASCLIVSSHKNIFPSKASIATSIGPWAGHANEHHVGQNEEDSHLMALERPVCGSLPACTVQQTIRPQLESSTAFPCLTQSQNGHIIYIKQVCYRKFGPVFSELPLLVTPQRLPLATKAEVLSALRLWCRPCCRQQLSFSRDFRAKTAQLFSNSDLRSLCLLLRTFKSTTFCKRRESAHRWKVGSRLRFRPRRWLGARPRCRNPEGLRRWRSFRAYGD